VGPLTFDYHRLRARSAIAAVACVALGLSAATAQAGSILNVDVQNYIIVYEGNLGHTLSINNFGTPGDRVWNGDIGIAGTGKLQATGPGTLNGSINFAAGDSNQAGISNTTINGSVNYGVGYTQTIMNNMNTLSYILGQQAGSGTSLVINTSSDQTVLASTGSLQSITGGGVGSGSVFRLFNVTSVNSGNGENLIIKADSNTNVVLDVNTPGDAQFHGNILLQDLSGKFFGDSGYAGITPDQLLVNLYGGSALVGGDKLDANNNGNDAHPANIIYGTFLDPNGAISMVNTRFTGRVFGGDTTNMQIVSGDTIDLPPGGGGGSSQPTPLPASVWTGLTLMGALGVAYRLRRRSV